MKIVNNLLFIVAFCSCLSISNLSAQTYFKPHIGVSQSKIVNDNEPNSSLLVYDEKFGYTKLTYGLTVSRQISEKWLLGIDVSKKTGGTLTRDNYYQLHFHLKAVELDYLDFTINTQYQIFNNRIVINLGLYQSLLLEGEWDAYLHYSGRQKIRKDEKYEQFDRGISLGLATKFKSVCLDLKYQHGLNKIIEDDKVGWISIGLGYEFRMRKKK